MSSAPAQVYVYYRVRTADVVAVVAAVHAFQVRLRALMPDLSCVLSRRAEDDTEQPTLMETYAHPDGVGPAWQHDIERLARHALAAWIVGERHVEVFVPLDWRRTSAGSRGELPRTEDGFTATGGEP